MDVAAGTQGAITVNSEDAGIDFRDYNILTDSWLDEQIWL